MWVYCFHSSVLITTLTRKYLCWKHFKFLLFIYLNILIMILNINFIIWRFCNFYVSEILVFIHFIVCSFLSSMLLLWVCLFHIFWVNIFLMYMNRFRETQYYSCNFLEIFPTKNDFWNLTWILCSLFNLWILFSRPGEKHSELKIRSKFSLSRFKAKSFLYVCNSLFLY